MPLYESFVSSSLKVKVKLVVFFHSWKVRCR